MDEIIRRLREIDGEGVTEEDYHDVGSLVSQHHLDVVGELSEEDFDTLLNRTDRVEDALLAAAYDDKEIDIGECILVLRGRKEPSEAELPEPSMEAFNKSAEYTDEEFDELFETLMELVDNR